MYFRIYKAIHKTLLWRIPCRKKYWRNGNQHAICSSACHHLHVHVVARYCLHCELYYLGYKQNSSQ